MEDYIITLIWGFGVFIIVFIVNYFLVLKNGYKNLEKSKDKKKKELSNFIGLSYLIPKFNLDIKKMNLNYVFILSALINAFIISTVFVIIYLIPWHMTFKMLLGFVLLFGLIYALYELLGRHLVKKGWKN